MGKLAPFTLLFVFTAGTAMAQQNINPGFDNQTGRAQNAARLSGLHNPNSQVHQPDTAGVGPYSAPGSTPLTTDTAPPAQGSQTIPGSGPYGGTMQGMTPNGSGSAPPAPN